MSNGDGNGQEDVVGEVTGGDHTHGGAAVTAAQLNAGEAVVLTLTGDHTHTVQLSIEQVMDIDAGQRVEQITNPPGHVHTVIFNG